MIAVLAPRRASGSDVMRACLCIVVTGGRDYADRARVFWALDLLKPHRVAQGKCRTGADALAAEWCLENNVSCPSYPAHWEESGRAAGPIRNGEMLRAERPDLLLAFPGGNGTEDCKRQARALGVPVMEVS